MRRSYILAGIAAMLSANAAYATDLIQNGDFSLGYSGFSSDYTAVPTNGSVYTTPPDYALVNNPAAAFTNGYLSFGDHTSGNGLMLFFDGTYPSSRVWYQSVSLAADTDYTFSFYATSANGGPLVGSDFVDLLFMVNGLQLGNSVSITGEGANGWQLVSHAFKTGAAGAYTLAILDGNGTAINNDGVIDDIMLQPAAATAVPEPASWALMLLGFGGLGYSMRRRRSAAMRFRTA